ncbi:MAG: hypothetical protein AAB385_06655 [Planctomycetota bacterium]
MKDQRLGVLAQSVNAVESKNVKVQMKIQRASKPLYKRYDARLCAFHASRGGLRHVPLRNHVDKYSEDGRKKPWVSCHEGLDVERHREDPLADGDIGQHVLHQMSAGIGHPTRTAAWTDSSTLARKSHQDVSATLLAPRSGETVGEDAALHVLSKLLIDIPRKAVALILSRDGEQGFEVLAHEAMKQGRFGSPPLVGLRHGVVQGQAEGQRGNA